MNSLFPGRDPQAGTDAKLDALLEQALRSQRSASSCRQPTASPQTQPPAAHVWTADTPIPPLLKPYWAVFAVLLLALIQMGCEANRLAPHASASSAAKPTHSSLPAKLRQEPEPTLATVESELPPAKSMTWVREDEPTIEVTGPVPADPFADWAPRAVLENLPAPLVALPVRAPKLSACHDENKVPLAPPCCRSGPSHRRRYRPGSLARKLHYKCKKVAKSFS